MKRAEILAAAANAIALLVVSALVTYDAVVRLVHPSTVDGAVLIVVAAVGVAVNVVATADAWPGPTGARSTSRAPTATS